MWPFIRQINLIRYLVLWRVNRSLVRLPKCLPAELSLVLGAIIADRLPTREASRWRKALAPWNEYQGEALNVTINKETSNQEVEKSKTIPEISWPVETVLFAYPSKMSYGQGELIMWELKLLGENADHSFFLEVILPAMEEASSTADPRWHHHHSPWGRFDIDSIYVARGPRWAPIVQAGKLDVRYRATPTQWAEGLTFGSNSKRAFKNLTWLTPFDLGLTDQAASSKTASSAGQKKILPSEKPTLQRILEALIARMAVLLPGKYNTPDDVWDSLDPEEKSSLQEAIKQVQKMPAHFKNLKPVPDDWPGRWIGAQAFPTAIPPSTIPYLELASILHIGKHTHFGCGTFLL
jgi:hypothetical protein